MGYFANFIVYTLAMIGVIAVALLIFKNSNSMGNTGKSKYMKVLDSISLAPRKKLYIIAAGQEKFLIASDIDKTTFLSKLENHSKEDIITSSIASTSAIETSNNQNFKDTLSNLHKLGYMDRSNIGINSSLLNDKTETPYSSVIKNLAMKMKQ